MEMHPLHSVRAVKSQDTDLDGANITEEEASIAAGKALLSVSCFPALSSSAEKSAARISSVEKPAALWAVDPTQGASRP